MRKVVFAVVAAALVALSALTQAAPTVVEAGWKYY